MNYLRRKVSSLSLVLLCAAGSTLVPLLASAQPAPVTPSTQSVALENPLRVTSITELLEALLTIVIVLATPVIVFFIIYAGFLYVTARGNAEQVKQATHALTYAIIGGVVIIGAMAIATIVKNLVSTF